MNFKNISILIFLCIISNLIICQSISKEVTFNSNSYNTYKVKINSYTLKNFHIWVNSTFQKHINVVDDFEHYYDSINIDNSLFLTNPGIVLDGCAPIGLMVDDYKVIKQLNTGNGNGNFYNLKPNGALLIKEDEAIVCKTADVQRHSGYRIGIQSGPMLVHDGAINSFFNSNSNNRYIRSGVGIIRDSLGQKYLLFAISNNPVSFYEFSDFYQSNYRCQNALCIESGRSVMNIPYLNNSNSNDQEMVCIYLYHKQSKGSGTGTGFLIAEDGLIATNYHVIDGASSIKIKGVNGDFSSVYNAIIKSEDKENDIAILKIDDPSFTALETPPYLINQTISDVATKAYTLGYPMRSIMGDEIKFTDGRISAKSGLNGELHAYSITVPIQPGNSGGPLFDYNGNVIGITSHGVSRERFNTENANCAIKSNYLLNLIGMLDYNPKLPITNKVSNLDIPEQIKVLKRFVYSIEVDF
tara:strand:+ start:476 stop:1882 length:1407 start_codon:yes stop_codon:yes gene_type:complete